MANGRRGEGNRVRINTTSRGPVNPDCAPQATDNALLQSGGQAIVIGPRHQPAQIIRGDGNRRGDNGDGSRSR